MSIESDVAIESRLWGEADYGLLKVNLLARGGLRTTFPRQFTTVASLRAFLLH